jgi:diadenosine tetraphosphate (Ap4A) HIT family hydrolase
MMHVHVHLIPLYVGDVPDPKKASEQCSKRNLGLTLLERDA